MFSLDDVVPWGRSFDEYCRMFALAPADLGQRILGCADGPASFNAAGTRRGVRVISADPLYQWTGAQIQQRIDATAPTVLQQTRRNSEAFVWDAIPSVEALGEARLRAMAEFLADYEQGRAEYRYVTAALPWLPFDVGAFDLALCSHFLFLYSEQFDEAFHRLAVREMARVATELRIFPLLALDGRPSPHVDACVEELRSIGRRVVIERVDYEFQRGGNEMLRASRF